MVGWMDELEITRNYKEKLQNSSTTRNDSFEVLLFIVQLLCSSVVVVFATYQLLRITAIVVGSLCCY